MYFPENCFAGKLLCYFISLHNFPRNLLCHFISLQMTENQPKKLKFFNRDTMEKNWQEWDLNP
jgi:hypothetical protein